MSCPDFVLSAGGRAGIGVAQQQFAGNYPFVDVSDDIKYLIADLYLVYDDPNLYRVDSPLIKHPLSIKYLDGVGCPTASTVLPPAHAADIQIVDRDGVIVFNSFDGGSCDKSSWSVDYDIYEWKKDGAVCRLVAYKTWPLSVTDSSETRRRQHEKYIAPAVAVLDERAVYRMPKRLLSLKTKTGASVSDKLVGNIAIKNGYNTEIVAGVPTSQNFLTDTRVVVSAEAGSGLGRFNNCETAEEDKPIVKINGVSPFTGGDFLLSSTGCLWAQRPVTPSVDPLTGEVEVDEDGNPVGADVSSTAHLTLGADCKPCCGCDDYAETAQYMNQVAYRYGLIGQRANEVYLQHEANVAQWSENTCGRGEILSAYAVPQSCGYIDYVVALCNTCEKCIKGGTFVVELYVPTEAPDIRVKREPDFGSSGNRISVKVECGYARVANGTAEIIAPIIARSPPWFDPSVEGAPQAPPPPVLENALLYPLPVPFVFAVESAWPMRQPSSCRPEPREDPTSYVPNAEGNYNLVLAALPTRPPMFDAYLSSKYAGNAADSIQACLAGVPEETRCYVYEQLNSATIANVLVSPAAVLAKCTAVGLTTDDSATTMLVAFEKEAFATRVPIKNLSFVDRYAIFANGPEPAKVIAIAEETFEDSPTLVWAKIAKPVDFPDTNFDADILAAIGEVFFYDLRYFYRQIITKGSEEGPPWLAELGNATELYLKVRTPIVFEIDFPQLPGGGSLDARFRARVVQYRTVFYILTDECGTGLTKYERELRIGDGLNNVREDPLPEELDSSIVGNYYAYIPANGEVGPCTGSSDGTRPDVYDPWTVWKGYRVLEETDEDGNPVYAYRLTKLGKTTTRLFYPTGAWQIGSVITGEKPTGAKDDLSTMYVLSGCEGEATSERAIIENFASLNCTAFGTSPSANC